MKKHLFDFKFEKNTINYYIIQYCKQHDISWFNGPLGGIYAKVGDDYKYYKLEAEYNETKQCFEVFACMTNYTLKYT